VTERKPAVNALSMVSQSTSQSLHPLSLLAQLINRRFSGCLKVVDGSTTWLIYLDRGQLAYASNSDDPFDRLDRYLRQMSREVPTLMGTVRVQMRLIFDRKADNELLPSADYQAIGWLVEQKYLTLTQASQLIEVLAQEAITSFLTIAEGNYALIAQQNFEDYPNLCKFDLRSLVEHCHSQLRQPPIRGQTAPPPMAFKQPSTVPLQLAPPVTGEAMVPDGATTSATALKDPAEEAIGAGKTRHTVACIDDSPTILQSINTFLDESDVSVLMIEDPVKALMQVVRNRPDLILLDVGMPNLDGYELCSLLRRHPHFKRTPIIMVTANTGLIDRAKAKLVGASGYLAKPFTQSELLKAVFQHLR
jgi:two-component system, chemotaxis family, response regulator PixG